MRRHLGVIHLWHHVFLLVVMPVMISHDGHTDVWHRDTGSGGYGHNVGVDKGIRHAVTGSDGCTRHVVAGFGGRAAAVGHTVRTRVDIPPTCRPRRDETGCGETRGGADGRWHGDVDPTSAGLIPLADDDRCARVVDGSVLFQDDLGDIFEVFTETDVE